MSLIFWPNDKHGLNQFGVKGEELHNLSRAGVPVPEWFVIPPESFYMSLTEEEYDELLAAAEAPGIPELGLTFQLSYDLNEQIHEALKTLTPAEERVAVRPSPSVRELTNGNRLPGYESYLFVDSHDTARAVRAAWMAAFSAEALRARQEAGLPTVPKAPAVIIQRMLATDCAGIAYSADPATGSRREVIIHSVPGLSTAMLVENSRHDTFRVDDRGRIARRMIAEKRIKHVCHHEAEHGIIQIEVPEAETEHPSLTDQLAIELAAVVRRVASHTGRPQAVGWACVGDAIHALGTSDIRQLRGKPDPEARLSVWDAMPMARDAPGALSPLAGSLYANLWGLGLCGLLRRLGHRDGSSARVLSLARECIGWVDGRLHMHREKVVETCREACGRPATADRLATLLCPPSEGHPREDAGEEGPDAEAAARNTPAREDRAWREFLPRIGPPAREFEKRCRSLEKRILEGSELLEADEFPEKWRSLAEAMPTVLAPRMLATLRVSRHWERLRGLTLAACGDRNAALARALLSSPARRSGVEASKAFGNLADLAAGHPRLTDALRANRHEEAERILFSNPKFADALQTARAMKSARFSWLHLGHLPSEESETEFFLGVIQAGKSVNQGLTVEGGETTTDLSRRLAREKIDALLVNDKASRSRILAEAARLDHWLAQLDAMNRPWIQLLDTLGGCLRRLGKKLHDGLAIPSAESVDLLTLDEIFAFLNGTQYSPDLHGLAAQRLAKARTLAETTPPPSRLTARGPLNLGDQIPRRNTESLRRDTHRVHSTGCGNGTVRARVRIGEQPEDLVFRTGDILALAVPDSRFLAILHAAGGLIVERARAVDDLVLTAINLGKPVIIGPRGVLAWISDGEIIEINPSNGQIHRATGSAVPG